MTSTKPPLKICVDKTLPINKLAAAQIVALRENAGNAPDPALAPDAINLLRSIPRSVSPFGNELGAAVMFTSKRWQPGRIIKVAFFEHELLTHRLKRRIRFNFRYWEKFANIDFQFIGNRTEDADIRISVERGFSASYLGTDALVIPVDEPTMWLGWVTEDMPKDEMRRVVRHEVGHALGLGHEHQNPEGGVPWNEDAVYRYYMAPPNNWTREDVYYQVLQRYSIDLVTSTERDPYSIMHYPIPAELLTDPSYAVGWNTDLSKEDKRFIAQAYPGVISAGEAA